jgi:PhnB protein
MTLLRPLGLTPHLFVRDADAAVAFYRTAFGAAELLRTRLPDGRVLLVELAVGAARLLLLEVDDPDAAARLAIDAGAAVELPVQEMFFGERYGVVGDPFGHRWALSTAREELTPDDIARRAPPDAGRPG